MTAYDALRRLLSEWPRLQWSVVFLVGTLGLAVLYVIVLTAVAYFQSGMIAGYAFGQNVHLPQNAIIMMEEECTTLPGWVPYARAAGRMPIGAGMGSDINQIARTFRVGAEDGGGEYVHTLTVDEMPAHTHEHARGAGSPIHQCGGDCLGFGASTTTSSTGGSNPHNNMPPTFAMNFCIRR